VDVTAVWALLLVAGCVVLGLVGLAAVAERPRSPRPDPRRLRAEAEELATQAGAAHAKAGRAAAVAIEAHERLAEAERAREDAWAAQEAAGTAYQIAWQEAEAGRAAAAERSGAGALDLDDTEGDRQRDVSRAALSAYKRGDISVDELREVWRRAGDWDPEVEELDRRAYRCRLEERAARRAYERAALVARQAAQAARVADVAAQAMTDEAVEVAAEAHEALLATQRYARKRRSRRR
jgi:hypothetical protein